jgi:addiction module RelE/StbE family toxin
MIIGYRKGFEKKTRKLPVEIRAVLRERLRVFMATPHHPLLHNHTLTGSWRGYRSINVTGDWRAIYQPIGTDTAVFVEVGTHHDLYGS